MKFGFIFTDIKEEKEIIFYVKHNGNEHTFDSGAKCLIFDYGNYWDIPESEILEYVEFVHYLYLKDNNPTPLGHLCDYIGEHWADVKGKAKWDILYDFYMSL